MPKLIWVVPKNPLPSFDGARKASATLLKSLSHLGLPIHLVILEAQNNFPKDLFKKELGLSKVTFLGKKVFLPKRFAQCCGKLLNPFLPLTFQLYNQKYLKSSLKNLLEHEQFEYIVADGLHASVPIPIEYNSQLLYRAHNVEYELWKRWSELQKNILYKLIGLIESLFVKKFERNALKCSRRVFPISAVDQEKLQQLETFNSTIIPVGFSFKEPLAVEKTPLLQLLWVGKLNWKPNYDGLSWFIKNIWPAARESCTLTIIGSGNLPFELGDDSQIEFLKNVPDLVSHYAKSHICLVPIQFGSGTRVKAIEAASFGRACLSTSLGLEGLSLEHRQSALISDTVNDWINILKVLNPEECQRLGINAFNSLKKDWEEQEIAKNLVRLLA